MDFTIWADKKNTESLLSMRLVLQHLKQLRLHGRLPWGQRGCCQSGQPGTSYPRSGLKRTVDKTTMSKKWYPFSSISFWLLSFFPSTSPVCASRTAFYQHILPGRSVCREAPAIPLALSWEGPGEDQVYGMGLAWAAQWSSLGVDWVMWG